MYDDNLEQLVLSGALFSNANDREPGSPTRSHHSSRGPSPALDREDAVLFAPAGDSDEEFGGTYIPRSSRVKPDVVEEEHESIGLGPGRTGVKGVIRDRNEARERESEQKVKEQDAVAERMKKLDLSARTYFDEMEEEETRMRRTGAKQAPREGDAWRGIEGSRKKQVIAFHANPTGPPKSSGPQKYGHLRELAARSYVDAVENVPRDVWVVLHIYDPSLQRCAILDSQLSALARTHTNAKFLRVRAGAIGFATTKTQGGGWDPKRIGQQTSTLSRTKVTAASRQRSNYVDPDESDDDDLDAGPSRGTYIGGSRGGDDDDDNEPNSEDELEPDYDMLPTMLVYRAGELMFTWVRVDWEIGANAGQAELAAFLSRNHILQPTAPKAGEGGLSDDDDDLEAMIEFAPNLD